MQPRRDHLLQLQQERAFCNILPKIRKKLLSVLVIFMQVRETSKKNNVVLAGVLYIHYPPRFQKDINTMQVLLNLSSKANVMTPV